MSIAPSIDETELKRRKSRALVYLIAGFVIVMGASFLTTPAGIMRQMRDASGQPIRVDGNPYPLFELDVRSTLLANSPAYLCAMVGIYFLVRAAIIRFRVSPRPTPDA